MAKKKNLYKEKKQEQKKVKKNTKKEAKKEAKRRKKIRTTFDWIDIEDVTDDYIALRKGKFVTGLRIIPENIFLMDTVTAEQRINHITGALNRLNQRLYIQFPQTAPHLDQAFNHVLSVYERQSNEQMRYLAQTELDKINLYESSFKDLSFYWMIQTDRKNFEDDLQALIRLTSDAQIGFEKMTMDDYQNVILDKFDNKMIKDYYFPTYMSDGSLPPVNMAKTRGNKKFMKSRSAPYSFTDHKDYYALGDHYECALSVLELPEMFYMGLLAGGIANPQWRTEIYIEPTNFDMNKFLTKRLKQLEMDMDKAKEPMQRKSIGNEIAALNQTIVRTRGNYVRSLNFCMNLFPRFDKPDDLNQVRKRVENAFDPMSGWQLFNCRFLQKQVFQESSPLFIESAGLRKDQREQMGMILSTESAAGLWPYIFETMDDTNGYLLGYESTTGGHVIYNPFLYNDDRALANAANRTDNNLFISGRTGCGKTTLVKSLLMQQAAEGVKIIYVDPENALQRFYQSLDAVYIDWKTSKHMINVFDLKPISNDDENDVRIEYNTEIAISNNTEDIKLLFQSIHPNISSEELSLIEDIVLKTYEMVGIDRDTDFSRFPAEAYPTFTTFAMTLDQMIDKAVKAGRTKEAGLLENLRIKTKPFTGSYGRFFDGHTTFDANRQIIFFGMKEAQNKSDELMIALNRVVFQKAWSVCLEYNGKAILAFDESHKYILAPDVASSFSQFARRARKYNAGIWFITQQASDYVDESIATFGKAILENCTYKMIMAASPQAIRDMIPLFDLNDSEVAQMNNFSTGRGLFIAGTKRLLMNVFVTQDQFELM